MALRLCINYLATCLITCMRHLKTDTPSPIYTKAEKTTRARARTHRQEAAKCYCKFNTFVLSAFYWRALHRKKTQTFPRTTAIGRETLLASCKFHCNRIANAATFCLFCSTSLAYFLLELMEAGEVNK
jgi:hypothetical protein